MASKQPRPPPGDEGEPAAKKPKVESPDQSRSTSDGPRVQLNLADCALDFNIEANGLQGNALHEQGFAYCWSGARANVGIRAGKYCFGCKIVSEQVVDMVDTPLDQQHLSRVGISRGDDSVGSLGETFHSFGFGGTGKFSSAGKFLEYGEKFGVGDTIVCAVDLDKKPLATIGFSRNGKWLGIAKEFNAGTNGLGIVSTPLKELPWESALFPHVLLKNVVVHVQFSLKDGLAPEKGYKPWSSAIEDGNAILGPTFSSPEDCDVLMMVGLPASGKTTWAEKWLKERSEKRYVLLGTNLALDQMKVPGLLRKRNYGERFELLMDRATGIFNTLLSRAANTPRNYILDQTNVYKSARNRKLKPFMKYRKVAVVVFPAPEELKIRAAKRFEEMGKEVPADAVNEMLANYVLPTSKNMPGSAEHFDEVIFAELNRQEAQRHLKEMKHALALSSNLNNKSEFSPYSKEKSSIRSFSTPLAAAADQESTLAFEGHQHVPQPNVLYSDFSSPMQAAPLYSRSTYSSQHSPIKPYRNYEASSSLHQRDGFDRFQSHGTTPDSFQRSEVGRYGSFDRVSSIQRSESDQQGMYGNMYGRTSFAFDERSPYNTSRSTDAFPRTYYESPSPISRPYGYSPSPASYGDHGGRYHDPTISHQRPYQTPYYGSHFVGTPPGPGPSLGPSATARDARPPMDYSPPSWHRR